MQSEIQGRLCPLDFLHCERASELQCESPSDNQCDWSQQNGARSAFISLAPNPVHLHVRIIKKALRQDHTSTVSRSGAATLLLLPDATSRYESTRHKYGEATLS